MKKYLWIQSKRLLRYMPGAVAVTTVLVIGLLIALSAMTANTVQSDHHQKVSIAIVGAGDDPIVDAALSAMTAFDSSQYSLSVQLMTAEEAMTALRSRKISGYVDVPEGFLDQAFNGRLTTLRFVTRAGSTGLITIFRDEITMMISDIVLAAQKGVYGLNTALKDAGGYTYAERIEAMNDMNMTLIGCILTRDGVAEVTELGVGAGLTLADYMLCGLFLLLSLLTVLPFAPVHISTDSSLSRMLASKGRSVGMQAVCDWCCWFVCLSIVVTAVATVAFSVANAFSAQPIVTLSVSDLLYLLPVLLMVSSMSFWLYTLSTNLIGGVLLNFFVTVALCFVSGCMYPVFFFPETVQTLAGYLPTGAARDVLSGCVSGTLDESALWWVLGYSVIFAVIAVAVRVWRVKRGRV